jgi:hypothetical protein
MNDFRLASRLPGGVALCIRIVKNSKRIWMRTSTSLLNKVTTLERQRDRGTEGQRDRETERQRDRGTEGGRVRQTETEGDGERHRGTNTQRERERERGGERGRDRERETETESCHRTRDAATKGRRPFSCVGWHCRRGAPKP